MSQMACWTQALGPNVLAQTVRAHALPEIRAVRFVCRWEPDSSALWVGSGEELLELLQTHDGLSGMAFFASGDVGGLLQLAQDRRVDLVITSLELIPLYEALSAALRRYQDWNLLLLKAAGRQSFQGILTTAAQLAGGALFLLDAVGRVTCSSICDRPGIPSAHKLLQLARLPAGELPPEAESEPGQVSRRPVEGGDLLGKTAVRGK